LPWQRAAPHLHDLVTDPCDHGPAGVSVVQTDDLGGGGAAAEREQQDPQ
jgi:hypothetical protein